MPSTNLNLDDIRTRVGLPAKPDPEPTYRDAAFPLLVDYHPTYVSVCLFLPHRLGSLRRGFPLLLRLPIIRGCAISVSPPGLGGDRGIGVPVWESEPPRIKGHHAALIKRSAFTSIRCSIPPGIGIRTVNSPNQ